MLDERTFKDPWGITWRADENFKYTEWVNAPLKNNTDLGAVDWPDFSIYESVESVRERMDKYKDEYFMNGAINLPFKRAWFLRGLENTLMDMHANKDFIIKLMTKCAEYELEKAKRLAIAGVDMIGIYGDIAMQDRMLINPEIWREIEKSILKYIVDEVRSINREIYFFYHSDGNIMDVIPDFIEIGFQVINPIQPECMNPVEVKRRFGDKITMHGTVSLQQTMPYGTQEVVKKEIEESIRKCGYNGGLIICPSNMLQFDTPRENVIAIYDTVKNFKLD